MASDWFKKIRRPFMVVIGVVMLAAGIAMLVLPGPAIIMIPAALVVLAKEFDWARRLLQYLRRHFKRAEVPRKDHLPPR